MKRFRKYVSSCFTFNSQLLNELEDAISSNNPASVEENIGFIKDINTALPISGMTPLELALNRSNASMMELLLKKGSRVDVRTTNCCSLVFNACASGSLAGVKLLVERGGDISARSPDGCTCLLVAAKNHHLEVVSYLLELETCNVNDTTTDGYSVLHYIALLDNSSVMSVIIDEGADINAQTRSGQTPVFLATVHKCSTSLKVLLEAGADVNIETLNGTLPLQEAVDQNNVQVTRLLLKYGANGTKTAENGLTLIAVAISQSSLAIMTLLLDNGADIEQRCARQWTPLLSACDFGFLEGVRLLIERGADLSACCPDGCTCLIMAAKNRHRSVVSYLLELDSCDVNGTGMHSHSPLHYILRLDDPSTISSLISKGADINARTSDGESPVFLATKHSCLNSLKILLQSGADPNVCTHNGSLALYEAIRQKNFEVTRLLLKHGAKSTLLEQDGSTILGLTIERNDLPMMKLLLDHEVDMEQTCTGHKTALMTACSCGFLEPVKILKNRGADTGARTPDGVTCLLLAAKNRHLSVVSYLLDQECCAATDTTASGHNTLHYVALLNEVWTLERLISKGADINGQTQDGETPVFLATKNSCTNCLRVLLEAGADPDIGTKNGEFAIHAAVSQGNIEFVRMLLKHGADRTKIEMDGLTPIQRAMGLVPYNDSIVDSLLNDKAVVRTVGDASPECKLEGAEMNKLQREVKECIYCPITFEVMQDPVIAADGHTYERAAIEQWIRQKQESPVTRQPLASSTLIPNITVRHLISQFVNISETSANSP